MAVTAVADPPAAPAEIAQMPYRFEIVPLKHMMVDAYQRELTSFVEKIANNFNPALVGCLCVSERSKTKFAVIDGQTRAEGMRRAGQTEAPCLVFSNLTREQEASLFALFQTERRGMTSAARFNAQVVAKDPRAVEIAEVVEGLGLEISHQSGPGKIKAIAAIEFVYQGARTGTKGKKTKDPELVARTLETIKAAWPKLPDTAVSATMIRGLGLYLSSRPDVDMERLANRLGKVSPSALAKRAESLREGKGMSGNSPVYMEEAIEAQYRKTR